VHFSGHHAGGKQLPDPGGELRWVHAGHYRTQCGCPDKECLQMNDLTLKFLANSTASADIGAAGVCGKICGMGWDLDMRASLLIRKHRVQRALRPFSVGSRSKMNM
jgi:hypothetical protein